jgi:hypothetical protein
LTAGLTLTQSPAGAAWSDCGVGFVCGWAGSNYTSCRFASYVDWPNYLVQSWQNCGGNPNDQMTSVYNNGDDGYTVEFAQNTAGWPSGYLYLVYPGDKIGNVGWYDNQASAHYWCLSC